VVLFVSPHYVTCLEAFTLTKFNERLSHRQPLLVVRMYVSEKNPILIQLINQSALHIYNHEAGLLMGHKPNGLVSSLKKGVSGLDSYMMSPTSV